MLLLTSLAAGCTFLSGYDCYGLDIHTLTNASSILTQEACCEACEAFPGCGAAVHIPVADQNKSNSECLFKSSCPSPSKLANRVRCCKPGDDTCIPPKVLSCGKELASLPFCDVSLDTAARVADLLPRLTLKEKISQLAMKAAAVPRLGMSDYNFGGEALHGVWSTCVVDNISTPTRHPTGRTVCPTQFPAPIHMAASFNRDLWQDMAAVSSTEARGLYNYNTLDDIDGGAPCASSLEGCVGLSYYTPNINVARDPRWGRTEEIPGEDPYMNGE